jgi:hypothetical protein
MIIVFEVSNVLGLTRWQPRKVRRHSKRNTTTKTRFSNSGYGKPGRCRGRIYHCGS